MHPLLIAPLFALLAQVAPPLAPSQGVTPPPVRRSRSPRASQGATSPPAQTAALSHALARYGDGAAHVLRFTQIYTPAGFATARRESGTVWIQAPQRLRFDYAAPEKKIFTYDGGEGRFFSPEDKQLTVRKPVRGGEGAAADRLPDGSRGARGAVRDHARGGSQGARSPAPEAARAAPGPRLARARDRPGRRSAELVLRGLGGNRTEFRFEGWRSGKAAARGRLPDHGTPGTRIVEN